MKTPRSIHLCSWNLSGHLHGFLVNSQCSNHVITLKIDLLTIKTIFVNFPALSSSYFTSLLLKTLFVLRKVKLTELGFFGSLLSMADVLAGDFYLKLTDSCLPYIYMFFYVICLLIIIILY